MPSPVIPSMRTRIGVFARRGRMWSAKPLKAPQYQREHTPAAYALPATDELKFKVKEHLLAQPISRTPLTPRRPYPLWATSPKEDLLFVPRFAAHRFESFEIDASSPPVLSPGDDLDEGVVVAGQLREHQVTAVNAMKRGLEERGGGVLSLSCGGGKTVCALHIASLLRKKTLVVVHKTFLLDQWRARINEFLPSAKVGVLQGSVRPPPDAHVCVAMLQTLARPDFTDVSALQPYGLAIVDECHHIGARMFTQAMWRISSKYVLGLSATPDRSDGLGGMISHFLGPLTHIGAKNANDTDVEVQITQLPSPKGQAGDWVEYVTMLTDCEERNQALVHHIAKHAAEKQVLVLSDRVEHLKTLHSLLMKRNTSSNDASSSSDTKSRALSVGMYTGGMAAPQLQASEQCDVILGTYAMASEGLDLPSLSIVLLSTPRREISQCVGRVLRTSKALVIDAVDKFGANRARLDYYRQEGYRITHA